MVDRPAGEVALKGSKRFLDVDELEVSMAREISPKKWRRKIPQSVGWRSALNVIGASIFRWPAAAFQGRRNGMSGCRRLAANGFGEQIGVLA
jgi:hypothetical protein